MSPMKKELPNFSAPPTNSGIYKVVSFGVALVIWATTLTGKKDGILVRDMEVEFLLRADQRIERPVNTRVQVKISGPKAVLSRVAQMSRILTVNLIQEPFGTREVEITSRMLDLPGNVRLLSVKPNRIKVDIEKGTP